MQSVDEFTPSTTEPVFGSGLISQKVSSSTNNETNDSEKVTPSTESVVNGQNDSVVKPTENGTNGTAEVNGQHETTTTTTEAVEVQNDVKPVEEPVPATEQPNQVEPEPVSSTPIETSAEPSSTTVESAPVPAVAESTEAVAESTSTPVETPVPTESAPEATASQPAEVKGKVRLSKKKFSIDFQQSAFSLVSSWSSSQSTSCNNNNNNSNSSIIPRS